MVALPAYREGAGNLQSCLNNYTLSTLLAANIPEMLTVPTDENGKLAKYVTFGRGAATTDNFFAQGFNAQDGTDRATNGTFAEYVTNGTFASDTGWTKGAGWTIAAGVATATGAISTTLSQTAAIALIPGYSYTVTFTISAFTAGTIAVSLGGGTAGTARGSAATFVQTIVAGSAQDITFNTVGFTGSIDNVTISGWILGTGWTTDGSTAIATGAISTTLSQTANTLFPLVQGQGYLVTFDATRSAGSTTVSIGGTAGTARSTSATFAEVIIAGATQAISFATTGFTGTIDNVTIVPAPSVPIDATTGLSGEQNPVGYFLDSNITKIGIVSAGTPTITANFYK
jgi:hypothetical protein